MFEMIGEGHKIMAEGVKNAIDLDELERLAKAATPGPWKDKSFKRYYDWGVICSGGKRIAQCTSADVTDERKRVTFEEKLANAAYIAAACNAVPELIARVRELERQRDWLANKLAHMCSVSDRERCGIPEPCPYSKGFCRCLDTEKEEWIQAAKEAGE